MTAEFNIGATPGHKLGVDFLLGMGNRHGLVAGATGTGKTVTLQALAESFSLSGVPVFAADAKGDLSGMAAKGEVKSWIAKRFDDIGLTYPGEAYHRSVPVQFWDLHGKKGFPISTTVHSMGPLLLSRMLELNETQEGVINILFEFCDEHEVPLNTFQDLADVISFMVEHSKQMSVRYGGVSLTSLSTISRRLLVLKRQGATNMFGPQRFDIETFMRFDDRGRGYVNLLDAEVLMETPRLYSAFLMWLMSELFRVLPEIGNPPKPKMVFFFDEAHLLFNDAPKALIEQIERVVRLIRSKGVGIYFVSQSPADIAPGVAAQLGNRIQHALRGFTPEAIRAIRMTARSFRDGPGELYSANGREEVLRNLVVGEAMVSLLDGKGVPNPSQRVLLRPPGSRVGPLSSSEREPYIPLPEPACVAPVERVETIEPETEQAPSFGTRLARWLKS